MSGRAAAPRVRHDPDAVLGVVLVDPVEAGDGSATTGRTSPIDTPTSCAPGATPTYLPPLAVPRPAMMPATWVP